jgi:polar amino acid transport system substrate-binding protein
MTPALTRRQAAVAVAAIAAALAGGLILPGLAVAAPHARAGSQSRGDNVAVSVTAGQAGHPIRAAVVPCDPNDPTRSLRPSGPPQVSPGSFTARIRARGYLVTGVDPGTYHFGFLNPLDGQFEGFDIDMLHAISAAIFGSPGRIQYKAIPDAQRISAVQSDAVDIVAHTMTITCARLQLIDFSTAYFDTGQRVLVESNSPARSISDLGGQKVCATRGSLSLANVAAATSHPIPVSAAYWTDCLVKLQQGDVAGISTDDAILAGLAAQDPATRIVGPRFTSEPYGLAISQQHPDFVRFVNAVLDQLRSNGGWAASYARWIGTPVPAPPPAKYKD